MSFLKSFFGAMAAAEVSEKKRVAREREQEVKTSINNVDKILKYESNFLAYLTQINCRNADYDELISDDQIENGYTSSNDVWQAQHKIDEYKQKLKEYMRLGGDPIYVYDLRKMDLYIEIVRRLNEYGWLDKQDQYVKLADDTYWLERDWENERIKRDWLSELLTLSSNEVKQITRKDNPSFIPFDVIGENAVHIQNAYFLPQSRDVSTELFKASIAIKLTDNHIIFYDGNTHEEIHYLSTVTHSPIQILCSRFTSEMTAVDLNGIYVIINTNEMGQVQRFCDEHNTRVQQDNQQTYAGIDTLSGVEFEHVCKRLLERMGFKVETTKASGDGGIDLIGYNTQPLLSGKYIIQCKRYAGSVGEPIIRDLYGVVTSERANKGILMTTGHFTKSAIAFAAGKPLELIDGPSLKSLMNQYGLYSNSHDNQSFVDVVGDRDIVAVAQEIWERWNNDEYEDDYYELIRLKKVANKTNDEIEVATYINWLLEKVDFDAFDICDHSKQIVFWNEINIYIKKFLKIRTSPKSKLLSYMYQMKYVQNCILLERFTDAKAMFIGMMKDPGIQFNLFETLGETHNTAAIFENTGAFTFLFATWCNMYQMAIVSNDLGLCEYLNDHNLFHGIPMLQSTRIEDNLELIRSGKSGLNVLYFEKQQKLIQEISEWYACEPLQTKIFFRIENIDIVKSFFEYAYYDGKTKDDLIEFCSYSIEDGKMVIDYYATIDLENALRGYIPFRQTDLQ